MYEEISHIVVCLLILFAIVLTIVAGYKFIDGSISWNQALAELAIAFACSAASVPLMKRANRD
jgi:TRAP-type C4-dicarboxylate transport system permease small subunit